MPEIHIIGRTGMLGQALAKRIEGLDAPGKWVIFAAGVVGGIRDNMARPVHYLHGNLRLILNALEDLSAWGADRVIYIGSSCMYPRACPQPMRESSLWTGRLEPTNEGYAIAKLAGEALCRAYSKQHGLDFRTAILSNLYGPGDRGFKEPAKAHVIPALTRKLVDARARGLRLVHLMGTGKALREFMHVDDAARGILTYLQADKAPGTINIGSGEEIQVADLARLIARIVGYEGQIRFVGGEDGMPRKVLDSRHILKLGWRPKITLHVGLRETISTILREEPLDSEPLDTDP